MKSEISLYLVFGLMTTAIAVGGYGLLIWMGLHYFYATTLSWLAAVLFAFVTNRKYVFQSQAKTVNQISKEAMAFLMSRVGTWVFETVGLIFLIDGIGMGQMLPKYIMSVVVIVMNYVLSKLVVFRTS
ncbi:GtrA family protein [Fusibacter sp. JL216-2]|uniref:GtrA family protein n=1 Tax=Fusibacter sp. JL216-2 TaxID=3071453 RepID=UPI003D351C88